MRRIVQFLKSVRKTIFERERPPKIHQKELEKEDRQSNQDRQCQKIAISEVWLRERPRDFNEQYFENIIWRHYL